MVNREKEADWREDTAMWRVCWKEGHIAVHAADSSLCVRCWTGFLKDSVYTIPASTRAKFQNDEYAIWDSGAGLMYGDKLLYLNGRKLYTFAEVLAKGPNTEPPSKGD